MPIQARKTFRAGKIGFLASTILVASAGALPPAGPGGSLIEIQRRQTFRTPQKTGKRVAILVEDRVWTLGGDKLQKALHTLAKDLEKEGFGSYLETVRFKKLEGHRDGRYVLALREHFIQLAKEEKRKKRRFEGAILVGHFPDAQLVRTVNWRKKEKLVLRRGRKKPSSYNTTFLRRVPEIVADRCDLILSDLDGDWPAVYVEGPKSLPFLYAVFPGGVPQKGGVPKDMEHGSLRFTDFFHVNDGGVRLGPKGKLLQILDEKRDHELAPSDHGRPNSIALPEICVSRIDARGIAWSPKKRWAGQPLLDASGQPRPVRLASKKGSKKRTPTFAQLWEPDPALELRLLLEYFARNHAFRSKHRSKSHRPASFSWKLGSGINALRRADPSSWRDFAKQGYDIHTKADLVAMVQWLKRPADLRWIGGHSNGYFTAFEKTPSGPLCEALDGHVLAWTRKGEKILSPTQCNLPKGHADFSFYRALWQNKVLPPNPYLLIHIGCEVLTPPESRRLPFYHSFYGNRQNAECQLFYADALAIVGRSKVFYDRPRGFCEALASGKTFGEALHAYFILESKAKSWKHVGGDIGRKRAYFWAVIGDWTLRLL
jgi:hypothetical protein